MLSLIYDGCRNCSRDVFICLVSTYRQSPADGDGTFPPEVIPAQIQVVYRFGSTCKKRISSKFMILDFGNIITLVIMYSLGVGFKIVRIYTLHNHLLKHESRKMHNAQICDHVRLYTVINFLRKLLK